MRVWILSFILVGALALYYSDAEAQQPVKIRRIGYVSATGTATNQGPYVEALRQGLRELGHIEGKTYSIEYRGAQGEQDRVPGLVEELVQSKVDILVAPIGAAIRAARQATKIIPIVMIAAIDPVHSGWIQSLAHPGGNLTGISILVQDLNAKRLELLTEVIPRLSRVGILLDSSSTNNSVVTHLREYESAAKLLNLNIHLFEVHVPKPELEPIFKTMSKMRVGGLITITNPSLFVQQKRIAELAIKNKIPTMFHGSTWVDSGGLMSYSTDELSAFRRAATFIDKILKGSKPADLPVEQTTKFEFVINLRTAKQIALEIPQSVLFRAGRVIK